MGLCLSNLSTSILSEIEMVRAYGLRYLIRKNLNLLGSLKINLKMNGMLADTDLKLLLIERRSLDNKAINT
jgi:hypothetical protein